MQVAEEDGNGEVAGILPFLVQREGDGPEHYADVPPSVDVEGDRCDGQLRAQVNERDRPPPAVAEALVHDARVAEDLR